MKRSADGLGGRKIRPECFAISAFTVSALIATAAANAANSNPYNGIVDRNVFSLKPKVIQEEGPKEAPKPPVKLTLTGITTILGNKRALLKAQIPARPPEPVKDESYMLTEGQRDGGVEVISIDEKAGKVVVNNNGITETLDFVNNGAKLMAAAPVSTPGVIPQPTRIPVGPGSSGFSSSASRTVPGQNQPQFGTSGANSTGTSASAAGLNVHQQQLDPETQTVMMEVERERTRDQVLRGELPPLPPTEITPEDAPGFVTPPGAENNSPQLPF